MFSIESSLWELIRAMDEVGAFYVYAVVLFVAAFIWLRETTKLVAYIAAGIFAGMGMVMTNFLSWPLEWVVTLVFTGDSPYPGFIVASGIAALLVSLGLASRRQR